MNRALIYACIAVLSLGLSSCSRTDEPQTPQSPSESFERNISEDSKNIAELMASIPLTEDIVNKDYGFTLKMPYGSGDDLVYKNVYTKNFIFSTNNMKGNVPVVHSASGVYWTMPYKIGYTTI